MSEPPIPIPTPVPDAAELNRKFQAWREAALVAALALTLNLAGNARTSLWDRDEPRYAGCTREMIARGDWVYPTFNGEPRFHKPVLIYWAMRLGFAVAGDNPFGARLASAVAGAGTAVVVLALGRRMFGARVGRLSAVMMTTAPLTVIESKLATTDAVLALFLVGCQFCLWELSKRPDRRLSGLFWVLLGLATLTKGPVGPALLGASGLATWLCGGPVAHWGRLRWRWGLPLFVLVVAPWLVAVGIQSRGEFFRYSLGTQVAQRVIAPVDAHSGFPGYYLGAMLLTFHPWSALIPASVCAAWAGRRSVPSAGFLLGWGVGPLILLECVRTKLVHYYLPAVPACALLAAWLVERAACERHSLRSVRLGTLGLRLLASFAAVFAVGCLAWALILPAALRLPCLAVAGVIAGGSAFAVAQLRDARTRQAMTTLAATWAVTMLLVSSWAVPAAEPFRMTRVVGEKLGDLCRRERVEPLLLSFQEPSLVYAMKRPAASVRTWTHFYETLEREGSLATAMLHPKETAEFAGRSDHLTVETREVVNGFDLNRGSRRTVRIVVIRRKPGATLPLDVPDVAARPRREKLLVK